MRTAWFLPAHLPHSRRLELVTLTLGLLLLQATALELRAEELSLKGDLKSGLLYEVATRREEVKKLQAELGARIERAATIEFEAREATLRADKLATDAAQLGTTVSHLTRELDAAMQKVSALEQVCFTVDGPTLLQPAHCHRLTMCYTFAY